MAITFAIEFEDFEDLDTDVLVTPVETFVDGRIYILMIRGKDNLGNSVNAVPESLPSTPGVTWVHITELERAAGAGILYYALVDSTQTDVATTIDWATIQDSVAASLFSFGGTNESILQSAVVGWSGTDGTVTLPNAIEDDSLILSCFIGPGSNSFEFELTVGGQQTALTAEGTIPIFAQYNIGLTGILPVHAPQDYNYIGIGIEVGAATTAVPVTITSVNGGATIDSTSTAVSVLGTTFMSPQGTGDIIISPTNNISDPGAITQSDYTSWADGEVVLATLDMPSLSEPEESGVYFFAINDDDTVSAGINVLLTPALPITLHTMVIEEVTPPIVNAGSFVTDQKYEILVPGTTDFELIGAADSIAGTRFIATGPGTGTGTASKVVPVICESTDFSLGVTAWMNKNLAGEEQASLVTALDTQPTANPQYNCTFSKVPEAGVDTVGVEYNDVVGDIKSVTGGVALGSVFISGTTCA